MSERHVNLTGWFTLKLLDWSVPAPYMAHWRAQNRSLLYTTLDGNDCFKRYMRGGSGENVIMAFVRLAMSALKDPAMHNPLSSFSRRNPSSIPLSNLPPKSYTCLKLK